MKTSKHVGERTVRLIDARTLLVTDHDGTGSLYDLLRHKNGWQFSLTKINADGEHLGRPYTVSVSPPACTCTGRKYGYDCRHVCMMRCLTAAGKVEAA